MTVNHMNIMKVADIEEGTCVCIDSLYIRSTLLTVELGWKCRFRLGMLLKEWIEDVARALSIFVKSIGYTRHSGLRSI